MPKTTYTERLNNILNSKSFTEEEKKGAVSYFFDSEPQDEPVIMRLVDEQQIVPLLLQKALEYLNPEKRLEVTKELRWLRMPILHCLVIHSENSPYIKAVLDSCTFPEKKELITQTNGNRYSVLHLAVGRQKFDAYLEMVGSLDKKDRKPALIQFDGRVTVLYEAFDKSIDVGIKSLKLLPEEEVVDCLLHQGEKLLQTVFSLGKDKARNGDSSLLTAILDLLSNQQFKELLEKLFNKEFIQEHISLIDTENPAAADNPSNLGSLRLLKYENLEQKRIQQIKSAFFQDPPATSAKPAKLQTPNSSSSTLSASSASSLTAQPSNVASTVKSPNKEIQVNQLPKPGQVDLSAVELENTKTPTPQNLLNTKANQDTVQSNIPADITQLAPDKKPSLKTFKSTDKPTPSTDAISTKTASNKEPKKLKQKSTKHKVNKVKAVDKPTPVADIRPLNMKDNDNESVKSNTPTTVNVPDLSELVQAPVNTGPSISTNSVEDSSPSLPNILNIEDKVLETTVNLNKDVNPEQALSTPDVISVNEPSSTLNTPTTTPKPATNEVKNVESSLTPRLTYKMQSLSAIDKVLNQFELDVKTLNVSSTVSEQAKKLLDDLKNHRRGYEANLNGANPNIKEAGELFTQKCSTSITEAKKQWGDDLGWGTRLVNTLKSLLNAIIKLFSENPQRLFSITKAPASVNPVVDKAQEQIVRAVQSPSL